MVAHLNSQEREVPNYFQVVKEVLGVRGLAFHYRIRHFRLVKDVRWKAFGIHDFDDGIPCFLWRGLRLSGAEGLETGGERVIVGVRRGWGYLLPEEEEGIDWQKS